MTDIHIPAAALKAGARAYRNRHFTVTHKDAIRAAFNAIVKAWEGMFENPAGDYLMLRRNAIILPLHQQEKQDG